MIISTEKLSDAALELNSCGREFLADRDYTTIRENGRVDYHILYIEKGACTIEIDGRETKVQAGNIILFKPYERQLYRFQAADASISCYIHFSGTQCEALLQKFGLLQNRVTAVGTNHTLESIFSEMENEYLLKSPYYTESCSALLLHFLATAGRLVHYRNRDINIRSRSIVDAVCKHMHAHYDRNDSMAYYADMCHLSVSRFSHVFKEHTGKTPKAYLLEIRISVAKQLLRTTNLSVADIAGVVGFDDANYFSRMMKRHTGHSPGHYRN